MPLPKVIAIVGPTSSGKTALSLQLAKQFNGEIINADARQFYRGCSIGTGKVKGEWIDGTYQVEGIAHHLIDQLAPTDSITVADWREQAYRIAHDIIRRGKLPILVGGTGLYVQAFVDNLVPPSVEPQPVIRERIAANTLEQNQAWLKEIDPAAFEQIDIKNPRRIQRAIEVALTSGRSFTEQQTKDPAEFEVEMIGLSLDRDELNRRIDQSIDRMIAAGWLDEVRQLLDRGVPLDAPAFSSIGYRELAKVIDGSWSIEEAIAQIKTATHQYAKRQMTWFKKQKGIEWRSA